TAYLLTSTDHVGPYEVVSSAGGSVMASNGNPAPIYSPAAGPATSLTPVASFFPWYTQGQLSYVPSSAPLSAQATGTCTGSAAAVVSATPGPGASSSAAAPVSIRPPSTGDAGLSD